MEGIAGMAFLVMIVSLFLYGALISPMLRRFREGKFERFVFDFKEEKYEKKAKKPFLKRLTVKAPTFHLIPFIMGLAAVTVLGMFVYMPAYRSIGSYRVFVGYRFVWDMGKDGYQYYEPGIGLIASQVLGVIAVTALLVMAIHYSKAKLSKSHIR
jgi:hypothetical protein